MDGHILRKPGFSLVELAIAMGVIALLTSAILPMVVRGIEIKAGEKTITEVGIIQTAAQKYYTEHRVWPDGLLHMQEQGYLSPSWSLHNPWNFSYQIQSDQKNMTVKTTVPSNIVPMLTARLPQSSSDGNIVSSVMGANDKYIIPTGVIAAWSGTIANIPLGWVLCDGKNGTPDLRDKFIVGANQDDGGIAKTTISGFLESSGGNKGHDHGGKTEGHVLTIEEMPSHHHNVMINDTTTNGPTRYPETAGISSLKPYPTTDVGGNQAHRHQITTADHIPPFYALAFIMKI